MKVSSISTNSAPNFGGLNMQKILTSAANINSWQQRAALGVAAMTMQPVIDRCNKDVDEETRNCMKAMEAVFKNDNAIETLAKITAKDKTQEAIDKSIDFIKNQGGAKKYASVIGTITALGVMLFTNFAIDAPVTNWLTNKMNKKYEGDKNKEQQTQTAPKIQMPKPSLTPQNEQGGV